MKHHSLVIVLIASLAAWSAQSVRADTIYSINSGNVSAYQTGGHVISNSFITVITGGWLTVSGNSLYVDQGSGNTSDSIGVYNATTGAAINSSLVHSNLNNVQGIAVSGGKLYVVNRATGAPGT